MYHLRPYQSGDIETAVSMLNEHGSALGVAATGLGKGVIIAELARRYVADGKRVLILADMGVLVDQLADTVEKHLGFRPGIERASESSTESLYGRRDMVVVGTVQSQFSVRDGKARCEKWDKGEFGLVISDEAEAFLAPEYRGVLEYHVQEGTHLFGCTATPMRDDGQAMGKLFSAVAFNRDIRWGVKNGYLTPPRQGFVNVDLDFSRLRIRGEDYTEKSVRALLKDMGEREWISFASGIVKLSGTRQGIVVAPHVESAKAICEYINAVQPGMARAVYGSMTDSEKKDTLYAFKHNHYQVLCSVNMLTKGFDHPGVHNIFMCRPTQSKRLYTQVLGRGVRLADPAIGDLVDADSRRAAIAASDKPITTMFNMVGINASVRDLKVGDILGGDMSERQREAANRVMEDPEATVEDIDEAVEEAGKLDEAEASRIREQIRVRAQIEIEFADALDAVSSPSFQKRKALPEGSISSSKMMTLKRFKIPKYIIARLNDTEAGKLASDCIRRQKAGLCTVNQAMRLKSMGVHVPDRMTKREASDILDRLLNPSS